MNIISFPRSGQQLISQILKLIYNLHNYEYSYCEYYTCCECVPCKFNAIYCKNHDFSLDYEIKDNEIYTVFYRKNIVLQLEAYYRYRISKTKEEYKLSNLLIFIDNNFDYYVNFYRKWVYDKSPDVYSVSYEDFIKNPYYYVKQILNLSKKNFDVKKIKDVLKMEFTADNKKSTIKLLYKIDNKIYKMSKSYILKKLNTLQKSEHVLEIISNIT